MEMDIYERDSLLYSISNFIMLKAFHDAGVDVSLFSTNSFAVDINYSDGATFEIFLSGIDSLFEHVKFHYYDEVGDISDELLESILESVDEFYEGIFIIEDSIIEAVLSSQHAEELKDLINSEVTGFYEFNSLLIVKDVLVIQVQFLGMLDELAMTLIKVREKALELYKEGEINGILDQNN